MDNHFVPNLTLGPAGGRGAAPRSAPIPLDVHLMIEDPDRWAPGVRRGRRAQRDVPRRGGARRRSGWPAALRALGARAGLALRPATPVEPYLDLLPELDMLLVMTVEPGFGGQ